MLSRGALAAVALAAAFAALVAAYLQARSSNRKFRDEMIELRESMSDLRSELGGPRLAGTIERVTAAPAPDDRDDGGARGEVTAAPGGAAPTTITAAGDGTAAQPGSFDESLRLAEEQFHGEAIDAAWAGAASSSVERALAQIAPLGASVRGLSCHSTRCRLEMNLRDEASLESFQREALYGANVLWRGPMLMARDTFPDGSIAMVAHLVREPAR